MYDDRLGTDWTDISDEEAIDRAFALGVAAAFGYENRAEFDRLRAVLDTAYDRSIIDLAYGEGRQKADGLRGAEQSEVWDRLVGGTDGDGATPRSAGSGGDYGPVTKRPPTFGRFDLLEGGSDLGALRRPGLLDSDGEREE